MRALAPAKAILSGEHAVVFGAPALAVAVKRYAQCEVARGTKPGITLTMNDLDRRRQLSLQELDQLADGCRQRYRAFERGDLAAGDVLSHDGDLLFCALADFTAERGRNGLEGLELSLTSTIPVGAGMGSSAATVAALIRVVAAHLGIPLTLETLIAHTRRAETLQHGQSSGIDPAICCAGNSIRYQNGALDPLDLAFNSHWYLADSGRPMVSTGVCCDAVRQRFQKSAIWSAFSTVTQGLEASLRDGDDEAIIAHLRENHRLLCTLGVVPGGVARWIEEVEASGGAAKISGAGATEGESAGLLLIYHPELPVRLRNGPYSVMPMEVDTHGARLRD